MPLRREKLLGRDCTPGEDLKERGRKDDYSSCHSWLFNDKSTHAQSESSQDLPTVWQYLQTTVETLQEWVPFPATPWAPNCKLRFEGHIPRVQSKPASTDYTKAATIQLLSECVFARVAMRRSRHRLLKLREPRDLPRIRRWDLLQLLILILVVLSASSSSVLIRDILLLFYEFGTSGTRTNILFFSCV